MSHWLLWWTPANLIVDIYRLFYLQCLYDYAGNKHTTTKTISIIKCEIKSLIHSQTSAVASVEFGEWISIFILHFTGYVIIYPCLDWSSTMLANRVFEAIYMNRQTYRQMHTHSHTHTQTDSDNIYIYIYVIHIQNIKSIRFWTATWLHLMTVFRKVTGKNVILKIISIILNRYC